MTRTRWLLFAVAVGVAAVLTLLLTQPVWGQQATDVGTGSTNTGTTGEFTGDKLLLRDNNTVLAPPGPNVFFLRQNAVDLTPDPTCANLQGTDRLTLVDQSETASHDWRFCRPLTVDPPAGTLSTVPTLRVNSVGTQGPVFQTMDSNGNVVFQTSDSGGYVAVNPNANTVQGFLVRSANVLSLFGVEALSDCLNIHSNSVTLCNDQNAITAMSIDPLTNDKIIGHYVSVRDNGLLGAAYYTDLNRANAGGLAHGFLARNGGGGAPFAAMNEAGGYVWSVGFDGSTLGGPHRTTSTPNRPACNNQNQGWYWYEDTPDGQIDQSCNCIQKADNSFAWVCDGQGSFIELSDVGTMANDRFLQWTTAQGGQVIASQTVDVTNNGRSLRVLSQGENSAGLRIQSSAPTDTRFDIRADGKMRFASDAELVWTNSLTTDAGIDVLGLKRSNEGGWDRVWVSNGDQGVRGVQAEHFQSSSAPGTTLPVCGDPRRGTIIVDQHSGTGDDAICVCVQNNGGTFGWHALKGACT